MAPQLLFRTPETPQQNHLPLPRKGTAKENLQSFASSFCASLPTQAFLHCTNGIAAVAWKSLGLSPHPGVFDCIQPWHLYSHRQQKLCVASVTSVQSMMLLTAVLCPCLLPTWPQCTEPAGLWKDKLCCSSDLRPSACDNLEPFVPEDRE